MNLKSIYHLFASHPESTWIMIPENAQRLYRFVKTHDIKNVLDLGTGIGCSVSIAALALQEKGIKYHIDSIEQFDKCVKIANELIPRELKENITIHKANVTTWKTDKIPYQVFSVYDSIPKGDYDLIINDGPGPFLENENYVDLNNGTILKLVLENKIKPGCFIIYDGRILSLRVLERYLGGNFYLLNVGEKGDLNILEKIDIPLKFEDVLLKRMRDIGYFNESPQTRDK